MMEPKTFHQRRLEMGWEKAKEDLLIIREALEAMYEQNRAPTDYLLEDVLFLENGSVQIPVESEWIDTGSKVFREEFPSDVDWYFFVTKDLKEAFTGYLQEFGTKINSAENVLRNSRVGWFTAPTLSEF